MAKRSGLISTLLPSLSMEANAVSYLSPNSFQVTGRDARTDYAPGVVVYIPGINKYAGVVVSTYSSENTTVILYDGVCTSGMHSVGRVSMGIGSNACTASGALSGGVLSGYPSSNAFDGDLTTHWASLQTGTGISGVSYIGNSFSVPKAIRWLKIIQYNQSSSHSIQSAILQYYNGSAWVGTNTISLDIYVSRWEVFVFDAPGVTSTQWRLLANSNLASGFYWSVTELQMGE